VETWKHLDIAGHFIAGRVLEKIASADLLVADVTRLNFNVTFEVGYALGHRKRVVLVTNRAFLTESRDMEHLGLFDTLGRREYENSRELCDIIVSVHDLSPLYLPEGPVDRQAPIFVLDTVHKTDASVRLVSRIKKSRIRFRSFDPREQARMSALDAYGNVLRSVAVVVHLLASEQADARDNNLRAAFLAGLAMGCGREVLLLQEGDEPVPIDYRDFVSVYRHPEDVDIYIADLAPKVMEALQEVPQAEPAAKEGLLELLDLGSPAAENEAATLGEYYLKTDQYEQVLRHGARLVLGRKGSGKTALFFQVRDHVRRDRQMLVLDLKPEGHQLKRFKVLVLDLLQEAVQEHVAEAFWEYVLYLELCYKILDKDHERHMRDHTLYEGYERLARLYRNDVYIGEADFSERMLMLVNRIADRFAERFGPEAREYLSAGEVTQFLYQHDVPELRAQVLDYLSVKSGTVILFDNLDKGWPSAGVGPGDVMLLRGLLEATRKLEREFAKRELSVKSTVFLRNDVYQLLVEETPDRGKESSVSLDWSDPDLLRELVRLRLVHGRIDPGCGFQEAWSRVSVSHVRGEESSQYLMDRSLMRPRNLLTLVNHAKSFAVNLGHDRISEEDLVKACQTYSADVARDVGLEMRDVFPLAEDIIYCFIDASARLTLGRVYECLGEYKFPERQFEKLVEMLLWFGFLGVVRKGEPEEEPFFIYDVYYDIKKLRRLAGDFGVLEAKLAIHKAFWPFLSVRA
jgi:hypothetical protein